MGRNDIRLIVVQAMSHNGAQLELECITENTDMAQDAKIDGIDVDDFVAELADHFGDLAWQIPWGLYSDQRASFRGCAVALAPLWLIWRLLSWPLRGEFVPIPKSAALPRLTVGHLVDVFERGEWFEP